MKEFCIGLAVWVTLFILVVLAVVGYSSVTSPEFCKNKPMRWDPEISEQYDYFGQEKYYKCSVFEAFVYTLPFVGFYTLLFTAVGPFFIFGSALNGADVIATILLTLVSPYSVIPLVFVCRYLWKKRKASH